MASIHLPPAAGALVPSLRGLGYSLQTAIADLIDNSITAQASRVDIVPDWNGGKPVVAIVDDGQGMDRDTLVGAMRFGCAGPGAERAAGDLGRFGLGLKTASLSQARRLTVASCHGGAFNCYRWDLDHIEREDANWELLEGAASESKHRFEALRHKGRGTVVLWEEIDFGRKSERPDADWFRSELALLEHHLAMVFHRFLADDRLNIFIGGTAVAPWDPFLEAHDPPADRVGSDAINAPGGRIRVTGFVMPHPDRFNNSTELTRSGGPEGWSAHQGFFIYRGDRLLTHGGWLGLGRGRWTRQASSQLARIRIEIPTTADSDWQIDVKKSVARPPAAVRRRLETLAADVRTRAREVYAHRGPSTQPGRRTPSRPLWRMSNTETGPRYRIERNHPAVEAAAQNSEALVDLLNLIERALPVERIWLDRSEAETPPAAQHLDAELLRIAVDTVHRRISRGESEEDAIAAVASAEPFDSTSDVAQRIRIVLKESQEHG